MTVPDGPGEGDERLRSALAKLRVAGINTADQIDPALRAAFSVPVESSPAEARELVRRSLLHHSGRLDNSLRMAFLEAAGFRRDAPASAGDRMAAAAGELGVSRRTAYRQVDKAIQQIAAQIFSRSERAVLQDIDYVFQNAHVRVDFTRGYPSIVTERTISARSDGIRHLDERLFFPRLAGPDLDIVALEGCSVEENTFVGPGVWSVRFRLSRELALGDQHTFAVSLRLPDHESLEPVVGFLPHTTSFDATIEFHFGDDLPAALQQFVTPPPLPGVIPDSNSTWVTPAGRRHSFTMPQMRPGLCYGVRWHWASDTAGEPGPAVPVL